MIKNIIFDFGDVFINLDKPATERNLATLGVTQITQNMLHIAQLYEMGLLSTEAFVRRSVQDLKIPSDEQFVDIWNAILLDFPTHRFDFVKKLAASKKYRLFLLSNTNKLHINWVKDNWGMEVYNSFKALFEQFYLSYEISLRKPNFDIFEFLLQENNLLAEQTLFIDDTPQNTKTAEQLGMKTWTIDPMRDDVVNLFNLEVFSV